MKHKHTFFLIALLLLSYSLIGQKYTYAPAPKWVAKTDIPQNSTISKYDINAGYYMTLADYQILLDEDAYYHREVVNVISYSGITNASQISVAYDTIYQDLTIHHLYIWRNGKKIDRTEDLSLEILSNEQNLSQGIYTGQINAYDILNDIRKDDLIDFSYTITGDNPIFYNEKYLFLPLRMLNPIDHLSIRVMYSKNKDYVYTCSDCDNYNYSVNTDDLFTIIEIRKDNLEAFTLEENMPTWYMPYEYFLLSSFGSWKDVNKWAQDVFALDKAPKLDVVLEEVLTGDESTSQKINKLIDYVQDDIRYMGIMSGIGSIQPFPPEQVVEQRFGDCKDKSLLLVSLLKEIGVSSAYPALVNVNLKHEIENLYPGSGLFNHCIVTFDYQDTTYWVDPSISLQGGDFRDLYTHDYQKALIIGKELDSLHVKETFSKESLLIVKDEYTIESFDRPVHVNLTSERYGKEADDRRSLMEYITVKDLNSYVVNNLKLIFPSVRILNNTRIEDDLNRNSFIINYEVEVDDFWEDFTENNNPTQTFRTFKFEPVFLYQNLNISACEERLYDFEIAYPLNIIYKVIFHFPEEILINDDSRTFKNDAFFFEERFEQLNSKSMLIEYTLQTLTNSISAEQYEEICKQKNQIAEKLPFVIYFPK
jgi:hypothetical protein